MIDINGFKLLLILCGSSFGHLPPNSYLTNTTLSAKEKTGKFSLLLHVNTSTSYQLILELSQIVSGGIFSDNFELIILKNRTVTNEYDFQFLKGFVENIPLSSVSGYLKNHSFFGTLTIGKTTYCIDEIEDYDLPFETENNALVYVRDQPEDEKTSFRPRYKSRRKSRLSKNVKKFKKIIGHGKTCTLAITLDPYYICFGHNNDVTKAVDLIRKTISHADWVYRRTDFVNDGKPSNIGFEIRKIMIILSDDSEFNMISSRDSLSTFWADIGEFQMHNDVCIGMMVTSSRVGKDILGLSYVGMPTTSKFAPLKSGGACNRVSPNKNNAHENILYVEYDRGREPYKFDITVMHEIGHSFGSPHDTSKNCKGYIMYYKVHDILGPTTFQFSPCSKESIVNVLASIGTCFEDVTKPFCGNGILEGGEECDCGECVNSDCCHSRLSHDKGCTLKKECDPSQGLCCQQTCTISDIDSVDCRKSLGNCPCTGEKCSCGVESTCVEQECHSLECTRLGLKECSCPVNQRDGSCTICCILNEICQSAELATQQMVKKDENLLEKLTDEDSQLSKKTIKICLGSDCKDVSFKKAAVNDYCVNHGRLGTCNENFKCEYMKTKNLANSSSNIKVSSYFLAMYWFVLNKI